MRLLTALGLGVAGMVFLYPVWFIVAVMLAFAFDSPLRKIPVELVEWLLNGGVLLLAVAIWSACAALPFPKKAAPGCLGVAALSGLMGVASLVLALALGLSFV